MLTVAANGFTIVASKWGEDIQSICLSYKSIKGNTSINRERLERLQNGGKSKMIPKDDLQALHIEYDTTCCNYLRSGTILNLQKYLHQEVLDFYVYRWCHPFWWWKFRRGIRREKQHAMKGTIKYITSLQNALHINGSTLVAIHLLSQTNTWRKPSCFVNLDGITVINASGKIEHRKLRIQNIDHFVV